MELPKIQDLKALLEGPQYVKWRTFRENEDSKYAGLLVTRFLTRSPYEPQENPIKKFNYKENVHNSHNHLLWGNTIYAFATRLTDSFANYRWCGNIIGPKAGGAVKDLPTYIYESFGTTQSKIPTEVLITDRCEYELAESGFIAFTLRRDSNNAVFFSANAAGTGEEAVFLRVRGGRAAGGGKRDQQCGNRAGRRMRGNSGHPSAPLSGQCGSAGNLPDLLRR